MLQFTSRLSLLKQRAVARLPDNPFTRFVRHYGYVLPVWLNFWLIDLFFRHIYIGVGHTELWEPVPILFTLAWSLILTAVIVLLPRRAARVMIVVLPVVYNALVLVHGGMYSFNGRFFSWSDLMFADDGAAFFHLEYIFLRKITIAVCCGSVLLSLLPALIYPRPYKRRRLWVLVVCAVLAASGIVTIRQVEKQYLSEYAFVSWDSYRQYSDLYQSFTDTPNCMMLTGLYQYTFRDLYFSTGMDLLLKNDKELMEEITEYYSGREIAPDNEMTGVLADKNLILIQLEAIDTWMLTEEAMPNLYALKQESVDFVNHYAPMYLSGGTFNTEIMVNLGHLPPVYGGNTGVYGENEYPLSLANQFSALGYNVNSFHNSRDEVYARGIVHPNWGYKRYWSGDNLYMPNIELDSNLMVGFDKMTEGDRFFSFIITYSGHGAYIDSEVSAMYYDKFAAIYPDADEMYIHAMAHAHETDLFIGALVEKLKETGLYEDTVLVFYGDHYNYYVLDDALVMKYKDTYDVNLMKNVPFFICSPNLSPQKVEKITSSIDILPTLVNLFDFEADARFYAGNDAFSDGGGYVVFKDYAWYDGQTYYQPGVTEDTADTLARNSEITQRFTVSNNVFLTDYFARTDPSVYSGQ